MANPLASEFNGSEGSEARDPRLRCLLAFLEGIQADQSDGSGGEDMRQCRFRQAKIASATQTECSHRLGMGSLNPRSPGIPQPKPVRLLSKTSLVQDLTFGLLANGEESGSGS